jgi:hypothetical protein
MVGNNSLHFSYWRIAERLIHEGTIRDGIIPKPGDTLTSLYVERLVASFHHFVLLLLTQPFHTNVGFACGFVTRNLKLMNH